MKIIPELRFPEFENESEWDSTPLADLCELITKGTTPTTLGFSYTLSGVNFIKIESILEGNINLEKAASISTECNEALKRSQLNEDDILFSIAGALGVVTTVGEEILPANTNQALSIVRLKNKKQKDYVKAFLKSNIISTEIQKIKAGAAQPNISLNQVSNFRVLIPKNTYEQQKIATCLSSLDEVIAAHGQKLELLKDHKKGLMQNLFPQEGETVPKYRFKEFEKDGEWVEKKLGEVAEIITGNTPSTNEPSYYGGDKMFVSPADISDKRIVSHTKTTLTDLGFSKTRQIKEGSVVFVCIGSTIGKVAQNKYECATNQQLNSLIANSGYSNDFLYSILDANSSEIASMAGNHAVPIINKTSFSIVSLFFPPSLKEQQKIASCLSSLDVLITAQVDKIEQLQLHKKGLMQGLFPKIND